MGIKIVDIHLSVLEVLLGAQQVSCDGTLEYFTYIEVPKMSFGEESTRIDQERTGNLHDLQYLRGNKTFLVYPHWNKSRQPFSSLYLRHYSF